MLKTSPLFEGRGRANHKTICEREERRWKPGRKKGRAVRGWRHERGTCILLSQNLSNKIVVWEAVFLPPRWTGGGVKEQVAKKAARAEKMQEPRQPLPGTEGSSHGMENKRSKERRRNEGKREN